MPVNKTNSIAKSKQNTKAKYGDTIKQCLAKKMEQADSYKLSKM